MSIFDDREKAHERKFQVEQEVKFKIDCLAARLLGEWAVDKMALKGVDASNYIDQTVDAEVKQGSHAGLLTKVEKDLSSKGFSISRPALEKEFVHLQEVAHKKILEKLKS